MRRAFALAFCLLMSFGAHATLLTIDPDDYAHGTDLSHIAPGLTLQALWQRNTSREPTPISHYAPIALPVVAANCEFLCGNLNGPRQLGTLYPAGNFGGGYGPINGYEFCLEATLGSAFCRDGFTVLDMAFDSPTDFLQLETAWRSDAASIMAYNSAGDLLFACTASEGGGGGFGCTDVQILTQGLGGYSSTFIVEREAGDIARVIFGGMMGSASIGEITYRVPEPGTLALLSLGLLGAGLTRRRKI